MERTATVASTALKTWRERLKLNQTEAAAKLGLAQGRYSQFEGGTRRAGRKWAVRIEAGTGGAVRVEDWDEPVKNRASTSADKIRKAS